MKTALTIALLTATAGVASAQTVEIYEEPVVLPLEYTEDGIVRAQFISPNDVTPEQYRSLLREAEKVRAFRSYSTGVSTSAGTAAGTTIASPATPTVSYSTDVVTSRSHTVVKGDTLYNLGKRFGVSPAAITEANGIDGTGIKLGQTLSIPTSVETVTRTEPVADLSALNTQDPTITGEVVFANSAAKPYAVAPGDTLYGIAKRACVGVDALRSLNGLGGNGIQPGQKLDLPGGHCLK